MNPIETRRVRLYENIGDDNEAKAAPNRFPKHQRFGWVLAVELASVFVGLLGLFENALLSFWNTILTGFILVGLSASTQSVKLFWPATLLATCKRRHQHIFRGKESTVSSFLHALRLTQRTALRVRGPRPGRGHGGLHQRRREPGLRAGGRRGSSSRVMGGGFHLSP